MPLIAKTRSVMMAPPISAPMSAATIVVIGISMLRNAWRVMTVRSGRPFALAVRM